MDPIVALELSALSHLRAVSEATVRGDSTVQQTYRGATALVTGASGFLGKHLVEKLLRSTNVKKVYLLLRPKKEKTVSERLKNILDDPVFDSLRKQEPSYCDRLTAISGDITELKLGICEEDRELLLKEVNFIFHVAATTRFDETLAAATITNVRGTREVIELASSCKDIRAVVHVSTAFSHATLSRIKKPVVEQFYEVPISPEELIKMAETMDEKKLEDISKLLVQDWPNTYCFTKAVAEEVVKSMSGDLPVCIVRPAVVICSYREPAPGWVDMSCTYGPAGVMIGIGLGLIHTMLADRDIKIDVVPADIVNNAVVAAGWATAGKSVGSENGQKMEKKIYTVSNNRNPTTWGACADIHRTDSRKISTPRAVWYCYCVDTSNRLLFSLLFWLLHFIPAYVIDGLCLLSGRKRQFVKLYTKAYKLFTLTSFFTTNEWKFGDKNLQTLYSAMNKTDQQIYNFDINSLDWKELMLVWCMGLRKYMIKDGLTGTEYAVKKQFWLRIANAIVLTLYAYMWYKLFSFIFIGVTSLFITSN